MFEAKFWSDMFVLTLPLAEKIARPIVVYIFLIVGLRLAGKRELAQLNPFDLVVLLTLSNTVQNAIIGDDNTVTGGIIGAATLLGVNALVVRFLYRHDRLDELVEGAPTVLVDHGVVMWHELKDELITRNELEAAAHKQGFQSLDEVDRAVLEPGGSLTFLPKEPKPEESRHVEVLRRLDELERRLFGALAEHEHRTNQ